MVGPDHWRRILRAYVLDAKRRTSIADQSGPWYRDLCDYYDVDPERALALGSRSGGRKPALPSSRTTNSVEGLTLEDLWESRNRHDEADIHSFYNEIGAWLSYYGGGEGALWWLQSESGAPIADHRYVWYHEESCEPIRTGWIRYMLRTMEDGAPIAGWWWNPEGRRRRGSIPHEYIGPDGSRMVAYENTRESGCDEDGMPFSGLWDTPGFRHESLIVRSSDFISFKFPDARHPSWGDRNGVRIYGIKAERFWWDPCEVDKHGIALPAPNLQWHVMRKHSYVPPRDRSVRWYFRELPDHLRKDENYVPAAPAWRLMGAVRDRSVSLPTRLAYRVGLRVGRARYYDEGDVPR